jgi:hypothetical protein
MTDIHDQFTRWEKIRFYVLQLRNWFLRLKGTAIFGCGVAGWIASSWAVGQYAGTTTLAQAIQQGGFFLKLTSVSVLLWRLGLLQNFFNEAPWWKKPWVWFREFPTSYIAGTARAKGITIPIQVGTAEVEEVRPEPEDLEERVERLETDLEKMDEKVEEMQEELKQDIEGLRSDLKDYREAQNERLDTLNSIIEKVSIGEGKGFTWELMALAWLFAGTVCANQPEVIARGLTFLF